MSAEEITALVNACNPWNKGAAATVNNWTIGFTHVTPVAMGKGNVLPGTILVLDEQKGLCVACKDNTALRVDIFYAEEGFLPGWMLAHFGIREGMCFTLS
jgi:methionyl-tRNA formyltransferase